MKRIVIVDDDPGVQDAFTLIFPTDQYELTIYANGTPILTNQCPAPDIYLLDKQLSGADGLDLCRLLKSRPDTCAIPVIILSASPNIRQLAAQAGAEDMLEKPFTMKALREIVYKYTGGAGTCFIQRFS